MYVCVSDTHFCDLGYRDPKQPAGEQLVKSGDSPPFVAFSIAFVIEDLSQRTQVMRILYHTIPYYTMLYNTILYHIIPYYTIPCYKDS